MEAKAVTKGTRVGLLGRIQKKTAEYKEKGVAAAAKEIERRKGTDSVQAEAVEQN